MKKEAKKALVSIVWKEYIELRKEGLNDSVRNSRLKITQDRYEEYFTELGLVYPEKLKPSAEAKEG